MSVTEKKQTEMSVPTPNPNHNMADGQRAEPVGCGFCKNLRHVEDDCPRRAAMVTAFDKPTVRIMTPVMRYCDLSPMAACDHKGCNVTTNVSQCGGCRIFKYCGKAHQRADWPYHKQKCAALKAAEAAGPVAYAFQLATSFTFVAASKVSLEVLARDQTHPIYLANLQLFKRESLAIQLIKQLYVTTSAATVDPSDPSLTADLAAMIAGDGEKGLAYASILSLIYVTILSDKIALWKIFTAGPARSSQTVIYNLMIRSSMSGGRPDADGAPAWPTRAQLEQDYAQARIAIDAVSQVDASFWVRLYQAMKGFDWGQGSAGRRFHHVSIQPPLSGQDALSWTLHAWVQTLRASAILKVRGAASLDELMSLAN